MSREALGMSKEAWEISAANEHDQRYKVLITDCKVYYEQITRCVWFEFSLDVGEGAETRSEAWAICQFGLMGRDGAPGWDYIRGSGKRPPDRHSQVLLDLCEAVGIDYDDLMNDRVSMDDIIGKEVACAIGEKEIISVSSIYEYEPWEEEVRRFWGFIPVGDMLAVSVPD